MRLKIEIQPLHKIDLFLRCNLLLLRMYMYVFVLCVCVCVCVCVFVYPDLSCSVYLMYICMLHKDVYLHVCVCVCVCVCVRVCVSFDCATYKKCSLFAQEIQELGSSEQQGEVHVDNGKGPTHEQSVVEKDSEKSGYNEVGIMYM